MERDKIRQEIEKLREIIRQHDYRYYVLNQPTVTDNEYDALMRKLQELEKSYPEYLTADSPTQRVAGKPQDGFPPLKKMIFANSINGCKDFSIKTKLNM